MTPEMDRGQTPNGRWMQAKLRLGLADEHVLLLPRESIGRRPADSPVHASTERAATV